MESANEATLKVSGMSCSGCANAVERALSQLEGVHQVSVDLEENEVTVMYENGKVSISDLEDAVKSSGYTFEGLKEHN
jgi:copper ion binding protein